MQSLSDLMNDMGMTNGGNSGTGGQPGQGDSADSQPGGSGKNGQKGAPLKGMRENPNQYNYAKDHRTDSRDQADKKRELGQIRSKGGVGCGSGGGPGYTREVEKDLDDVEMALQEVMQNVKKRVVKMATTKDNMKNYNRGIIRTVIAPSFSRKITICNEPKIVYLIDISGSMDSRLIDRCLGTIARSMKKLSRGLKYDIITWSTCLGEHIKDIDPRHPITRVSGGGGTSIGRGIKYFKDNYGPEAILVIISDFEDYLQEWQEVESTMDGYSMYGFNYGDSSYYDSDKIDWKNLKVRKFKDY
jgi:predicted metal-dependent peptidase